MSRIGKELPLVIESSPPKPIVVPKEKPTKAPKKIETPKKVPVPV